MPASKVAPAQRTGTTAPTTLVEEYDPATNAWRSGLTPMPLGVAFFGIAVAGGLNTAEPTALIHVVDGNTTEKDKPQLRRRSARRQALRRDRLLLLNCPPTPPFTAGDQLDRQHTSALTTTRMSALWLAWLRVRLHETNELNFQPHRHVGTRQR